MNVGDLVKLNKPCLKNPGLFGIIIAKVLFGRVIVLWLNGIKESAIPKSLEIVSRLYDHECPK